MGDHQWLLLEAISMRPSVIAQGHQLREFVSMEKLLRRNPHRYDVKEAVLRAASSAIGSVKTTADGNRLIVTEPVVMTDGRVHGVQVWTGPCHLAWPQRPEIGALVWDLTEGVATDSPQALINSGMDPSVERTHGRALAEDLPIREANGDESKVLALAMSAKSGQTYCSTWEVKAHTGEMIRVNFAARTAWERWSDGTNHLVARAMNWRSPSELLGESRSDLANRIIRGTAQNGVHRALVDLGNWRLLKWIDLPSPYIDWRGEEKGRPLVHPGDMPQLESMTTRFIAGPVSAVLRMRARGGRWVRLHVTVYRIEVDDGVHAGLISTRLHTSGDLADSISTDISVNLW